MYWPVGPPRIFAAKAPSSEHLPEYDSDDSDSAEVVRNRISLSSGPEDIESLPENREYSSEGEHTDVSQKVGEQQVFEDVELPLSSSSESRPKLRFDDETRAHIVALSVARGGMLFASITVSDLTIWQTKAGASELHGE